MLLLAIGIELLMLGAVELIDHDLRWHEQHPKESAAMALQHERQDRLEGR